MTSINVQGGFSGYDFYIYKNDDKDHPFIARGDGNGSVNIEWKEDDSLYVKVRMGFDDKDLLTMNYAKYRDVTKLKIYWQSPNYVFYSQLASIKNPA